MNLAVSAVPEIQKPRTDDRLLRDIISGYFGYYALLIAHDLKLFPALAEKPCTLVDVCKTLKIAHRPAEDLLAALVSIKLIEVEDGFYSLSPVAEDYLLETSPTYFGTALRSMGNVQRPFKTLKKAVLQNSAQISLNSLSFINVLPFKPFVRSFIQTQHGWSMAAALVWPELVNLSRYRLLLDIGGGSGAHSIGAALRWTNLQAVVFDMPPVCKVTQEYVSRHGLQGRIKTHPSDMWKTPFPEADLHFYSSIYHNWSPEKCHFLTQKSFDSLPSGGRIILHEMLYNNQKTGPLVAAIDSLMMLAHMGSQQYSGLELTTMLMEAGFTDIEVKPSFGYWSIVTGCKP